MDVATNGFGRNAVEGSTFVDVTFGPLTDTFTSCVKNGSIRYLWPLEPKIQCRSRTSTDILRILLLQDLVLGARIAPWTLTTVDLRLEATQIRKQNDVRGVER